MKLFARFWLWFRFNHCFKHGVKRSVRNRTCHVCHDLWLKAYTEKRAAQDRSEQYFKTLLEKE